MNKVLLVGRLVADPEIHQTTSGIKYARFRLAVSRDFNRDQTDFIPVVAWRGQADFIESYLTKGSQVSVEGRFSSSTYQNAEGKNITRYEVSADRVESLESKAKAQARRTNETQDTNLQPNPSVTGTQVMKFAKENKPEKEDLKDVPWDLDL